MRRPHRRHCAIVAVLVAFLGGPAAAGPANLTEAFSDLRSQQSPGGWSNVGLVSPTLSVSKPSTVVVSTTDTFGNRTKAVANR